MNPRVTLVVLECGVILFVTQGDVDRKYQYVIVQSGIVFGVEMTFWSLNLGKGCDYDEF